MQGARLSLVIGPSPIGGAIRRVAVFLLDFDKDIPHHRSSSGPTGTKLRPFDRQPRRQFGDAAIVDRLFELRRLNSARNPARISTAVVSGSEIPGARSWFSPSTPRFARSDEPVAEEPLPVHRAAWPGWEAVAVGKLNCTKMTRSSNPGEASCRVSPRREPLPNDALRFRAVNDFPRLADRFSRRKPLAEETPPAADRPPDPLHEERFKNER